MRFPFKGTKAGDVDQNFFDNENKVILTLGTRSYINGLSLCIGYTKWNGQALIGRFCSLSHELLFLVGRNHNYKAITTSSQLPIRPKTRSKNPQQIIIGHDVWIGHGATILGGVKIGNGAVIGANAVVAKDIPPYAIAVGNPARVIKYRFDEETIKKMLAVKWWNWSLEKIADNFPLMNDVEKFLSAHYSPALEEFPEDNFSCQLNNFIGNSAYQFIADFEAKAPLWSKIIKDFKQANLADAVLVIWLGKDATEENSQALTAAIGDSKNILVFKHDENFSPAALKKATHFITTREMSTLAALDYLWNTDVKIISALDNEIFYT